MNLFCLKKYKRFAWFGVWSVLMAGVVYGQASEPIPVVPGVGGGEGPAPENILEYQDVETLLREGYYALKGENFYGAVDRFEQVVKRYPGHKKAWFGLGTAYIQEGQERRALAIFKTLYKRYPDDYSILNNLAWLYATAKDPSIYNSKEAIRLAQSAVLTDPGNHHIWSTLAEACYGAGFYARAERAAEEALRAGIDQKAGAQDMLTYKEQLLRSRRAAQAFSIVE